MIERHDDGTFTEYDADGEVIGYGDWRDEATATKHFHVAAGTVGCLPDGEPMIFETRTAAERYAISEARDYRDAGIKVRGNAKTGYAIDPIKYLMVEACTMAECLEQTAY